MSASKRPGRQMARHSTYLPILTGREKKQKEKEQEKLLKKKEKRLKHRLKKGLVTIKGDIINLKKIDQTQAIKDEAVDALSVPQGLREELEGMSAAAIIMKYGSGKELENATSRDRPNTQSPT